MQSNSSEHGEVAIIHGGFLHNVLARFGAGHATPRSTAAVCLLFIGLTWVAQAILAVAQGVAFNKSLTIPFFYDISEVSRFLVCGPILITAERAIEPWLRNVLGQFRTLVPEAEIPQFNQYVQSAVRMREMVIIEVLLMTFAILRPHFDPSVVVLHSVPSWQEVGNAPSWAQTYAVWVSKPLMGWLWLRWLFKYAIWSLLLCRISNLNLRLIPTHPDDTAGLGFVAVGQTKFTILAIGLAALGVGTMADDIIYQGSTLMEYRWVILTIVGLILLVFATPLLAFTPKLIECKRNGLFAYGRLAQEYVEAFDKKWIRDRAQVDESPLGHADIQSLADMENAYSVVQRMKVLIIDRSLLTSFVLATVLPFSPLILTMYQLDDLLNRAVKNLFGG